MFDTMWRNVQIKLNFNYILQNARYIYYITLPKLFQSLVTCKLLRQLA
jgi:hypothetical protein